MRQHFRRALRGIAGKLVVLTAIRYMATRTRRQSYGGLGLVLKDYLNVFKIHLRFKGLLIFGRVDEAVNQGRLPRPRCHSEHGARPRDPLWLPKGLPES